VFYDKYLPDWKGDIKVMELAWLGSLSRQKAVSANEMAVLIDQILDATGHLHVNGYTHRDIKPDNILIISRKPILAKLCDFGLTSNLCLNTFAGTENFVAPEILKQKLPGLGGSPYTNAVDIFSIGASILSLSLFEGIPSVFPPLKKHRSIKDMLSWFEWSSQLEGTESPSRPSWEHLTNLAKRMVAKEPDSRPSATSCKKSLTLPDSLAIETEVTAEGLAQEKLTNFEYLQRHRKYCALEFSKLINIDVHREPPIAINLVALCSAYRMSSRKKRRGIVQVPSSGPHYDLGHQHGTGRGQYISLRAAYILLLEHGFEKPANELLTLQHYIETAHLAGCDTPDFLTGNSEATTLQ